MAQVFVVGDEPVPGYKLLENISGTAFYRMWKVRGPNNTLKMWKEIDLVVGNVAVETRMLGLLVRLRHPNLSTLTNFWQLNDGRTLVIETDFPEMSLRDRYQNCRRDGQKGIVPNELCDYMQQAATGLDFLNSPQHEFEGKMVAVYHRALRPDCLLLFRDASGPLVCKVSDFGLAKPVSEADQAHSQGLMNYDYDPPEFFEGQTASSSDQYSLAINYYEMRTSELPFPGTMLEQLQARLSDRPNLNALPEPERTVVRRALMRDPAHRFTNSTEFVQELKSAASRAPSSLARPQTAVYRPSTGAAVVDEMSAPAPAPAPVNLRQSLGIGGGHGAEVASPAPPPVERPRPVEPVRVLRPLPVQQQEPAYANVAAQEEEPVAAPAGADVAAIRKQLKRKPPVVATGSEESAEVRIPISVVAVILVAVAAVAAGIVFLLR